ncbi:MAG: biotin--[acetyl-CoA-carboxylase] ligase [Eubacterium sp.]
MGVKSKVLDIFEKNRGNFISGGELSEQLNVSRNAIWKAVHSLQEEGYNIQAVTNKGYCLSSDSDIISPQSIKAVMPDRTAAHFDIKVFDCLPSTNNYLRELANSGTPEFTVVIAKEQTNGKGRLGRKFFSPAQTGIYISILVKPVFSATESLLLTTSAAVAVARAIEHNSNQTPCIKWVNDIFCNGKKVCGILTEASFNLENNNIEYAIVGIGINLKDPSNGYPDEISGIAGSIFGSDSPAPQITSHIIADILCNFMEFYQNLSKKTFLEEYKNRSIVIGKDIFIISENSKKKARVIDIDDECHLIVKTEDGNIECISSGEISIRLQ